ncbi:hypothetical protein ACGH2B_29695 [Streptomyces sp. BBFR2]|uniref:hypothetical protein n=1 Tax=Streptomyces sp. BBFR2 TaxID=3372854 RepID=UPI0037D9A604
MEELRRRLEETAAAHRPDRERMWARVERGGAVAAAGPAAVRGRRAAPWLRIAGATAAVAGVLAAGCLAVNAALPGHDPGVRPARVLPPAGSGVPSPLPRTEDGPLWSDGSVDPHGNPFWAQSDVTLKTARALTALTVELRIARTAEVRPTGSWRTLPAGDFRVTTEAEGGFLVFRWDLKPGRTVPAGRHVFAGQYGHARGGRDAGADGYTVRARSGGERFAVRGDFAVRPG